MYKGKPETMFGILCKRCVTKKLSNDKGTWVKLCKRCEAKVENRNNLALQHQGLIRKVVHGFLRSHPKVMAEYPFDDAVADGWSGLLRACELYDDSRGVRFSTYAFYWIRQSLSRAWDERQCMVRVPYHARRGHKVKVNQFDGDLLDQMAETFDDEIDSREISGRVNAALNKLHKREADIVRMRMSGMMLAEIGDLLGITRERVRQLEARAMASLENLLRGLAGEVCRA